MYFATIQQFSKTLKNLDRILEKSIKHAEARKFDPNNFCTLRLAPDMYPLTRQIQITCDVAKGAAANFSGKEAPKYEDNEQTMEQLRERIRKTHGYLETFREEDFKSTQAKTIVKVTYPAGKAMYAEEALVTRAIPNFFFHVTASYAILRAGGVDLGKMDFLGELNLFDAK